MNRNNNIHELTEQFPLIRPMSQGKEIFWNNDQLTDADSALKKLPFSASDIEDAEERWLRFAPFIKKAFPETEAADGMIESPLIEIPSMKNALNDSFHASLKGRLLLKMDSHLAAAGSVKARGGIYEILKHSEELALSEGMLSVPVKAMRLSAARSLKNFSAVIRFMPVPQEIWDCPLELSVRL